MRGDEQQECIHDMTVVRERSQQSIQRKCEDYIGILRRPLFKRGQYHARRHNEVDVGFICF